jgi:hypothetical protein
LWFFWYIYFIPQFFWDTRRWIKSKSTIRFFYVFSSIGLVQTELLCSFLWHKASLCFRPFWTGNASDKFLSMQTLLYVSFKHILINRTTFIVIPNSVRTLYNVSLLNGLQTFLKSDVLSHYSALFISIWKNAEYLISSWSFMSKCILMIPNNFVYECN